MTSAPIVLFDFDGTLADTAPGLAQAANRQRAQRGLEPLPYEQLRPAASQGARGLLRTALDLHPEHADYIATRDEFLRDYAELMYEHSALFPGIPELLSQLQGHGMAWGIVTNKLTDLTEPLVKYLQLQPAVVLCGDTTPHFKPHPQPLLHAAAALGVDTSQCLYVGDDLRDVQAGRAAGMTTVAAEWGYAGGGGPLSAWGADHVVQSPEHTWALIAAIKQA